MRRSRRGRVLIKAKDCAVIVWESCYHIILVVDMLEICPKIGLVKTGKCMMMRERVDGIGYEHRLDVVQFFAWESSYQIILVVGVLEFFPRSSLVKARRCVI